MDDKTSPSKVAPVSVPAKIAPLPTLTAGLFNDVSRDQMSAGKHRGKPPSTGAKRGRSRAAICLLAP
jgi:hypothetical protein